MKQKNQFRSRFEKHTVPGLGSRIFDINDMASGENQAGQKKLARWIWQSQTGRHHQNGQQCQA